MKLKVVSIITSLLLTLVICGTAAGSFALSTPAGVYGHVTVNGAVTSGVTVSLSDGQSTTASSDNGYYQFGINNGASYTVTATFGGHPASKSFTANGDTQVNLDITYTTASPSPSPSATATPTAAPTQTPSNNNNNGGISKFYYSGFYNGGDTSANDSVAASDNSSLDNSTPTPTQELAATETVTPTWSVTPAPDAGVLLSVSPTAAAMATITATPVPTTTAHTQTPGYLLWLALFGVVIVLVAAAYVFVIRR